MRTQSVVRATLIAATLILAFEVQAQPIGYAPDFVSPFVYTGSGNFSGGWGFQGIKGDNQEGSFVMTGTSNINGVVYCGPVNHGFTGLGSSTGAWYVMNVPSSINSAASTSIYGPESLGNGNHNLEGTYTSSTNSNTYSFIYTGPLTSTPQASHSSLLI